MSTTKSKLMNWRFFLSYFFSISSAEWQKKELMKIPIDFHWRWRDFSRFFFHSFRFVFPFFNAIKMSLLFHSKIHLESIIIDRITGTMTILWTLFSLLFARLICLRRWHSFRTIDCFVVRFPVSFFSYFQSVISYLFGILYFIFFLIFMRYLSSSSLQRNAICAVQYWRMWKSQSENSLRSLQQKNHAIS